MKRLLLVLALVVCFALPAQADSVILVSNNWPPYAGESLDGGGFVPAILKAACERAGLTADVRFMPWNRAIALVEKGEYDGIFNAWYNEERAAVMNASEAYAASPLVFMTKKGSGVTFDGNLNSLTGKKVGVVKGFAYTPEFKAAGFLTKEESSSDLTLLKKLVGGRTDVVIIDKYVALDYLNNDPALKGKLSELEVLEPPLGDNPLHVFFSKNRPGADAKLAAFNKGLAAIKADGTVDKIMKQYGF